MSSVTPDLHTGIVYATSARAVWEDLRERFDKVNVSRIYQLHKAIATTVQGNDCNPTYFSKLRNLWDEFANIVPPPCQCPNSKEFSMHLERQKLMQFLMGLNENYDQSRSQILMVEPTPNINKAYAMLIERESQRFMSSSSIGGEGTYLVALMAGKGMLHKYNRGTAPQNYNKDQTSQSTSQYYNKGKKNWDQKCDYCHMQGHMEGNCFKLHGYPPDWKFKKKGAGNNNNAYNVQAEGVRGKGKDHLVPDDLPRAPQLTTDQHGHIMKMLDGNVSTANVMANMAGMVQTPMSKIAGLKWIIDSGATNHMISSLDVLHDVHTVKTKQNRKVHLPNGDVTLVTHSGSCTLTETGELHDVLFVPEFHYNLLSISKVTKELNCFVSFYIGFCLFQDLSTGKLKGIGKEDDGLYFLVQQQSFSNSRVHDNVKSFAAHDDKKNIMLWHRRLTHASIGSIKNLLGYTVDDCKTVLSDCEICPLAKHTRLPFHNSSIRSTKVFTLLHLDVWGPYNTPTFDGNKFFLTIVDDFSRTVWEFLLKFKSDVLQTLKQFFKMVATQFSTTVKGVRTANGGEFISSSLQDLFQDLRIIHYRTCAHTPQQNGVAERKHMHLLEVARALRFQGHIPLQFWGHCVLTAAYIINRLPSPNLEGKSPYELFFWKKALHYSFKNT